MKLTKVNNLPLYEFEIFKKYPEITAFCSTRAGGVSTGEYESLNLALHVGDNEKKVLENRKILAKVFDFDSNDFTFGQQTHDDKVEIVAATDKGKGASSWNNGFTETDALITNLSNTPVAILVADCTPIFLYDPAHKAIGIVHSGRVGTEKEIAIKTIQKMRDSYGICPEKLIAAIGPCIHKCCYEIDLPKIIREQLISSGVKIENIEIADICTSCNNDIFYSYRAEKGNTGRFIGLITIK